VVTAWGKNTFMKSLDRLRPTGFGQGWGPIGSVDINIFGQKGSLYLHPADPRRSRHRSGACEYDCGSRD
jgi:hypothetical protein